MPRLDGFAATRELKQHAQTAGIPVVALTAHTTTEDRDAPARPVVRASSESRAIPICSSPRCGACSDPTGGVSDAPFVDDTGPFERVLDVRAHVCVADVLVKLRAGHQRPRLLAGTAEERRRASAVDRAHVPQPQHDDGRQRRNAFGNQIELVGRPEQEIRTTTITPCSRQRASVSRRAPAWGCSWRGARPRAPRGACRRAPSRQPVSALPTGCSLRCAQSCRSPAARRRAARRCWRRPDQPDGDTCHQVHREHTAGVAAQVQKQSRSPVVHAGSVKLDDHCRSAGNQCILSQTEKALDASATVCRELVLRSHRS